MKNVFISTKFLDPPLITGEIILKTKTFKEAIECCVQNIHRIRGLCLLSSDEAIWIRMNGENNCWLAWDLTTGNIYNNCIKVNTLLFLVLDDIKSNKNVTCNVFPVIKHIYDNWVPFSTKYSPSQYQCYGLTQNDVYVYFAKPVFISVQPALLIDEVIVSKPSTTYPSINNISTFVQLYEHVDVTAYIITDLSNLPPNSWLKHFIPL